MIIDDFTARPDAGTAWELVSDRVMGGRSLGTLERGTVRGRMALRLTGDVSLENDGGFLQFARDWDGGAAGFAGIELDVTGNGETYNLHLRTDAVQRSWQSYRASYAAPADWIRVRLPFAELEAHRLDAPFDPSTLRRIGIVAIGRAFHADIACSRIAFY